MKSITNWGLALCAALLLNSASFAQENQSLNESKEEINMETNNQTTEKQVYFIDKFFIPKNAIEEFKQRMKHNRSFIRNLRGFIKDEAYEQQDQEGNLIIITIAVWENQSHLDNAKSAVQTEFKRINFNPSEFYQRLGIKMERGLYQAWQD
jgi:hypothetical protein